MKWAISFKDTSYPYNAVSAIQFSPDNSQIAAFLTSETVFMPIYIVLLNYLNGDILAAYRDSRTLNVGVNVSPDALLWDNSNNLYVGM